MATRRCFASGLVVALLALLALPAAAGAAGASETLNRSDLVTAAEVARSSTRTGWQRIPWEGVFDCGTLFAVRQGAIDSARVAHGGGDARAVELAVEHTDRDAARAAFQLAVQRVRTCTAGADVERVTYDMPVASPGSVRMIRLVTRDRCCGSDTHSFGLVRRGTRVAVVAAGEIGETIPVTPVRRLLRRAAERLAG